MVRLENTQNVTTFFLPQSPKKGFGPNMAVKAEWTADMILVLTCLLLRFSDPTHIWAKGKVYLSFKKTWFSWLVLIAHCHILYYCFYYLFIKTRPFHTKQCLCVMPHSFFFPAPKVHALSPAQCHLTRACPRGRWEQRGADRHNQICSLLWICLKIGQNWVVSFTSWASISVLQYISCCWGINCKWLGKWSGCDTWVQMSLGMPLCSFLSTSPALLSRGRMYSNSPRVEAGKQCISSLHWSLTTPLYNTPVMTYKQNILLRHGW